jgi:hypothetical protein
MWTLVERRLRLLTAVLTALAGVIAVPSAPAAAAAPAVRRAPPARTAQAGAQIPNRVANFNICTRTVEGGLPPSVSQCYDLHKSEKIADEIERYRPQVIGLEEACVQQTDRVVDLLRRRGLRYHVQHNSVSDSPNRCGPFEGGSAFGNAILSAAPMTNRILHTYRTPGSSEPRAFVNVTTQVDGRPVALRQPARRGLRRRRGRSATGHGGCRGDRLRMGARRATARRGPADGPARVRAADAEAAGRSAVLPPLGKAATRLTGS